jgi:hypothetical protein
VATPKAAAASEENMPIADRVHNALPLIGIGVAAIVNAAWIGFLGYWLVRLI